MGFHMLTHHNTYKTENPGGLGLTLPVLAAYCKYPTCTSSFSKRSSDVASKKPGLFSGDCLTYSEISEDLKIAKPNAKEYHWKRHPLAFLAEAADDICNTIIDYEDGYKSGIIKFNSLNKLFSAIAKRAYPEIDMEGLKKIKCDREKAGYLRSKAIYSLTMKTAELFQNHERELLAGTFQKNLSDYFNQYDSWKEIRKKSKEKLYSNHQVLEKEIAGFEVIPGLLKIFLSAARDPKPSKHEKILKLLPSEFYINYRESQYDAMLSITTYVCGMTDGFAVDTYQKLTGLKIPNS